MKVLATVLIILSLQTVFFLLFPQSQKCPPPADLVIVFPGTYSRITTGIKLAQDGFASNLVISGFSLPKLATLVKKLGGKEEISLLDGSVSRSTIEDALIMRKIVKEHHFTSVILVTSAYHMPRSYLIARLLLASTGASLSLYPSQDSQPAGKEGDEPARYKTMAAEMLKLWGSGVELLWYIASGTLPRDIAPLQKICLTIKKSAFPSGPP